MRIWSWEEYKTTTLPNLIRTILHHPQPPVLPAVQVKSMLASVSASNWNIVRFSESSLCIVPPPSLYSHLFSSLLHPCWPHPSSGNARHAASGFSWTQTPSYTLYRAGSAPPGAPACGSCTCPCPCPSPPSSSNRPGSHHPSSWPFYKKSLLWLLICNILN